MENQALLEVENLDAGYGFLQVIWEVSLDVRPGEYVCLIGPNGAGKSTTLKSIAGLLEPKEGRIIFKGEPIDGLPGDRVCRKGISYISEELNLFTGMTVQENLAMGAYAVRDKRKIAQSLDFVFGLFPPLKERERQLAGTMSGGERKMLAIARGLMSAPSLLLVDEPSLGLAPQLTAAVFRALDVLKKEGVTILLVEQNVTKTLQVTDRGYVLEKGKIVLRGRSSDLARDDHVRKVYLGI
ncbi:MAG: ABC transporter ATP-binding protein [Deltaproteobacteria bacterium]|nr:ABC transporter ATP-binding protein [Deltaproteobacteria bacterium]